MTNSKLMQFEADEPAVNFITPENPYLSGNGVKLIIALGLDILANAVTKRLNVNAGRLYKEKSIVYRTGVSRTNDS